MADRGYQFWATRTVHMSWKKKNDLQPAADPYNVVCNFLLIIIIRAWN